MPVPSEASVTTALPLRAPALEVSRPTVSALLLVACGASRVNEPLAVTPGEELAIDAFSFSEKPSFAAVLLKASAWLATLPMRTLPKSTGFGATGLGLARRKTLPTAWITPVMPTDWLGSAVIPRPLVPVPSDAKWTVTAPFTLPAAAVFRPTTMLLESLRPAPSSPMLPPKVIRGSSALPKLALSFSEKPSFTARLLIVSAWLTLSPTWTLPKATGARVFGLGQAVRRGAGGEGEGHELAAGVVEVVDDRHRLAGERRQRAGRADRHHHVAGERGARRERAPVAGGHAAAREPRIGDVAAVDAGLDRAAQRRPGRAGVDDVVRIGGAADVHVADGQRRRRRVAVDDARAGEPLVRVAAGDDAVAGAGGDDVGARD